VGSLFVKFSAEILCLPVSRAILVPTSETTTKKKEGMAPHTGQNQNPQRNNRPRVDREIRNLLDVSLFLGA